MTQRFLLDTQIIYAVLQGTTKDLPLPINTLIRHEVAVIVVSVTSIWEIAIKWRIGKLGLNFDIQFLPQMIKSFGFDVMNITELQVLSPIIPEIDHRDPFDRLLLSICAAEDMSLVTIDRVLSSHALAWKQKLE
jgi:PIN domain nuclease of toxin-antitoxin system